ncbi:MAG TPA: SUMF1/EgtB/PvdO family nonheme iron enzyme [Methanomethylovorans sp.]|nr:SUMF1/EgtB/PvdO family nonheme iron enzyme [Methanomethylovorans sp.]
MEFVLIPAGELRMDPNRHIFEKPANRVIIPEPFYLGKYLVTQKEWRSVMGMF